MNPPKLFNLIVFTHFGCELMVVSRSFFSARVVGVSHSFFFLSTHTLKNLCAAHQQTHNQIANGCLNPFIHSLSNTGSIPIYRCSFQFFLKMSFSAHMKKKKIIPYMKSRWWEKFLKPHLKFMFAPLANSRPLFLVMMGSVRCYVIIFPSYHPAGLNPSSIIFSISDSLF